MFRLLRNALGVKVRPKETPDAAGARPPAGPPLRELGELPLGDPDVAAARPSPDAPSAIVGTLRAQKLAGMRERADRIAHEKRQAAEAAAQADAEQDERRRQNDARDRLLAQHAFGGLPELIRQSAARGLDAAALADGFVDDRPRAGGEYQIAKLDGRVCHLRGWQIPFCAMCEEAGIPLTIISERIETDPDRKQHRLYHMLAVDLTRL